MESVAPWLTPALLLGLIGLSLTGMRNLRNDLTRQIYDLSKGIDDLGNDTNQRFDKVDKQFDNVKDALAEQRERMAKLEGSLEGFLAGRRDRDAA